MLSNLRNVFKQTPNYSGKQLFFISPKQTGCSVTVLDSNLAEPFIVISSGPLFYRLHKIVYSPLFLGEKHTNVVKLHPGSCGYGANVFLDIGTQTSLSPCQLSACAGQRRCFLRITAPGKKLEIKYCIPTYFGP